VIETRPDRITPKEIAWLRYLGVTKVQMGVQSLDDTIQDLNRRGHTNAETLAAAALLRAAGFKIVVHWMPNLLGATPESDRLDFVRLWSAEEGGLGVSPDELKIYPTQLLETPSCTSTGSAASTSLTPPEQLVDLIADIKPGVPEYCRINRVIRDIPLPRTWSKATSAPACAWIFSKSSNAAGRPAAAFAAAKCAGAKYPRAPAPGRPGLPSRHAEEHFLTYVTPDDQIAGYLRLSLPCSTEAPSSSIPLSIPDLEGAALIREVHVYGQSLPVGGEQQGAAQHTGLGTALLEKADEIARQAGYRRMAVIAAVGTRCYYEARGFQRGELYMVKELGIVTGEG
jgi:elongator complex protein 3